MITSSLWLFSKVLIGALDLQLKRARTGQYQVSGGSCLVESESEDSECAYNVLHHGLDPGSSNNVSPNCATFRYSQCRDVSTQWKATVGSSALEMPSSLLDDDDIPLPPAPLLKTLVHGKAVEPENIPPLPSLTARKDFLWVTVSNVLSALFCLSFCHRLLPCYARSPPPPG